MFSPTMPEFADAIQQQAGDVVIAHQQQVYREVLAIPEQLVLAARKAQAATLQQPLRFALKDARTSEWRR